MQDDKDCNTLKLKNYINIIGHYRNYIIQAQVYTVDIITFLISVCPCFIYLPYFRATFSMYLVKMLHHFNRTINFNMLTRFILRRSLKSSSKTTSWSK